MSASLATEFCGLAFPNPFMLSSAPPAATGEMIARAFDAGWGGAVTKTLVLDETPIRNVTPRLASLSFPGFENEPKKVYALSNIELDLGPAALDVAQGDRGAAGTVSRPRARGFHHGRRGPPG